MAECEPKLSQHCSSVMLHHLAMYMKSSRYTMQTAPQFQDTPHQNHDVPSIQQQQLSDISQWRTVATTEVRKSFKKTNKYF
jgi:hypothetical protein